jgi:exosortase H (IPTLxxWG-CTERM-specific)
MKQGSKTTEKIPQNSKSKRPILRFALTIGILMALFYAVNIFCPAHVTSRFFSSYQHFNAKASGTLLTILGHDIKVAGETISSPDFSVNIKHGCDAVEPTALFIFAVLAFPAPFLKKLPGIIAGTVFLAIINIVRIVSLFLIGVYYPKAFHTMHVDVWQAIFILFAIVSWVLWALWSGKGQIQAQRVST